MWNLTKLETLEKAVVDTETVSDAAHKAQEDAWDTDAAYDDAVADAYDAWVKAKLDLSNYLKEQAE